ncbi:MAG: hypothetical protein Q9159_005154 [Coniocarpon cinnabarinum]
MSSASQSLQAYTQHRPTPDSSHRTRLQFRLFLQRRSATLLNSSESQRNHIQTLRENFTNLRQQSLAIVEDHDRAVSQLVSDQTAREEALAQHFNAEIRECGRLEEKQLSEQIRRDVEDMEQTFRTRKKALATMFGARLWEVRRERKVVRGWLRSALGVEQLERDEKGVGKGLGIGNIDVDGVVEVFGNAVAFEYPRSESTATEDSSPIKRAKRRLRTLEEELEESGLEENA